MEDCISTVQMMDYSIKPYKKDPYFNKGLFLFILYDKFVSLLICKSILKK